MRDRALHVHVDAHVNPVILQRADHFESRPIAHVSEPRIPMAAEVTLQDPSILRAIEQRAPGLQFPYTIRSFLRMQLGHPPVVHVLAAAHRVAEVNFPVVAVVDVGQCGGDAAFGHDGVRFPQQRLADQSNRHSGRGRLNGRPETRSACADHQHIVFVCLKLRHQRILRSDHTPIEHNRT